MNQLNTLNGELQHIIDNVRQIGSNSTDIQSPGLHLSISVDNNKLLTNLGLKIINSGLQLHYINKDYKL